MFKAEHILASTICCLECNTNDHVFIFLVTMLFYFLNIGNILFCTWQAERSNEPQQKSRTFITTCIYNFLIKFDLRDLVRMCYKGTLEATT